MAVLWHCEASMTYFIILHHPEPYLKAGQPLSVLIYMQLSRTRGLRPPCPIGPIKLFKGMLLTPN